jgi:hypothetical protein
VTIAESELDCRAGELMSSMHFTVAEDQPGSATEEAALDQYLGSPLGAHYGVVRSALSKSGISRTSATGSSGNRIRGEEPAKSNGRDRVTFQHDGRDLVRFEISTGAAGGWQVTGLSACYDQVRGLEHAR